MAPPPLTAVVAARGLAAVRAGERSAVLDVDHDLALLKVQFDVGHSPRCLDAQNPAVQFLVTHGASVALLAAPPPPSGRPTHTKPGSPQNMVPFLVLCRLVAIP